MEKCARCGNDTEQTVSIWFYGAPAKVCMNCYTFIAVEMDKARKSNLSKTEITMRDYFAAKAMQGLLSTHSKIDPYDGIEKLSYAISDAMLAEREKNNA